jgi:hypothetical protein
MAFDLLTLKNAKGKIDEAVRASLSSLQAELELRRKSHEKLSSSEKKRVAGFLQSIINLTDEGDFQTRLVRLASYVREHA